MEKSSGKHLPAYSNSHFKVDSAADNNDKMMTKMKLTGLIFILVSCTATQDSSRDGWMRIFNGKDLNNWVVKIHHHETGVNFGNTFRAEDGMIKVRYDQYGDFNDQFAHL